MSRIVEGLVTVVSALKKKDREELIERLLKDRKLVEELEDILILRRRRKEPTRPIEEFARELEAEGWITS